MRSVASGEHKGLAKLGMGAFLISSGFLLIILNMASHGEEFLLPITLSLILIVIGVGSMAHAGLYDTRVQNGISSNPEVREEVKRPILHEEHLSGERKRMHEQSAERKRRNNEISILAVVIGTFLVAFPMILQAQSIPLGQIFFDLKFFSVTMGSGIVLAYLVTHVFFRGGYTHKLRSKPRI